MAPSLETWLILALENPAPAALLEALAQGGLAVVRATTPAELEKVLGDRMVAVVLADVKLPGLPFDTLRALMARHAPRASLVVVADAASVGTAIEAVKAGARDYVLRPLITEDVLFVIEGARAEAAARPSQPAWAAAVSGDGAAGERGTPDVVGDSAAMQAVWALVNRTAPTNATVLIGGETGTGKELVARRLHQQSARASGPFVKVHCAALPDTLLESELFGYEKGAFTGAGARKAGRVEMAQGGTLFLDEIGDVSLATQVKLLRVLQDRQYERLGGTETRRADVRFVAATHRDLPAMMAKGTFREDLYYRLNVVRIVLPPLRDRRADIPLLARHFAALASRANGLPPAALTSDALDALAAERWPGNVRQLQNLIERLVVLSETGSITADDVRRELTEAAAVTTEPAAGASGEAAIDGVSQVVRLAALAPLAVGGGVAVGESRAPTGEMSAIDLKGAVSKAEKRQIEKALRRSKGNRELAARLLGISPRTLYYKLRVYGFE